MSIKGVEIQFKSKVTFIVRDNFRDFTVRIAKMKH